MNKFKGTGVALVTPFFKNGNVDIFEWFFFKFCVIYFVENITKHYEL